MFLFSHLILFSGFDFSYLVLLLWYFGLNWTPSYHSEEENKIIHSLLSCCIDPERLLKQRAMKGISRHNMTFGKFSQTTKVFTDDNSFHRRQKFSQTTTVFTDDNAKWASTLLTTQASKAASSGCLACHSLKILTPFRLSLIVACRSKNSFVTCQLFTCHSNNLPVNSTPAGRYHFQFYSHLQKCHFYSSIWNHFSVTPG